MSMVMKQNSLLRKCLLGANLNQQPQTLDGDDTTIRRRRREETETHAKEQGSEVQQEENWQVTRASTQLEDPRRMHEADVEETTLRSPTRSLMKKKTKEAAVQDP